MNHPLFPTNAGFVADILSNKFNRAIVDLWSSLDLQDGWLVAGCLFQTVWNLRSGRAPEHGIKDYDIFYCDPSDLTEAAEARVQQRVDAALRHLGVPFEVKNQARVHLWYQDFFGYTYPQLETAAQGIDRFLIPATCVGVRPARSDVEVYAPHGLAMLYGGILTPNPLTDHAPLFESKAASYMSRWDWLELRSG